MPTDLGRVPDVLAAARRLPPGGAVILRDAGHPGRERLARQLRAATRLRGQLLLIAGDPVLAEAVGADGLHLPEAMLGDGRIQRWRRRRPGALVTAAAHSLDALRRAERAGVDAALISPVFPTASHPEARTLGPFRAAALARASRLSLYAMGGIDRTSARRLPPVFAGIAAIGLFADSEA